MNILKTGLAASVSLMAMCLPALAAGPDIVFVSPNQLGVNQALNIAAAGARQAAEATGGTAKVFESVDPITRRRDLDAAAKGGADIVISYAFEFADILNDVPPNYPDTQFLSVDFCPDAPAANVHCILFRDHEMTFLAGAEAAWLNPTGSFAALGGLDIPVLHRYTDAFLEGVKHASPEATVRPPLWIGGNNPFSDPARASEMASALYFEGVDTILVAAGASGDGVVNAAKSMPGKTVVAADSNNCPTAPTAVLDNVERRSDRAIVVAVTELVAGTLPQVTGLGLKEGAVTLTTLEGTAEETQCLGSQNAEVMAKVRALREDIIAGRVTITDPMAQ